MVEVYPYQAWAVVEVCQGQQGSPAYQEGVVVEEEVVVQHRSYQALVAVEARRLKAFGEEVAGSQAQESWASSCSPWPT